MIREDQASSQGSVSETGGGGLRSDTPQSGRPVPTISPLHPVISVTDALGRVMPVVMVTQSDTPESSDTTPIPMEDSSPSAALVDFPAGYFAAGYNYQHPGNSYDSPVDLSSSSAAANSSHRSDDGEPALCSTLIRTQRSPHDLYLDLSRALESSFAKDLVQQRNAESGLFVLADVSVSLEVRVSCSTDDAAAAIGEKSTNQTAALCFRHLAGDVALYDNICRDLVSRLSL